MIPFSQWLSALPSEVPGPVYRCGSEECTMKPDEPPETLPQMDHLALEDSTTECVEDLEQARLDISNQLDQQGDRLAETLTDARLQWNEDQSRLLATQLERATASIEASLASSLAGLLRPFLADAVRNKAYEDFVDLLRTHLNTGDVKWFSISAPRDLLDLVRGKLDSKLVNIEFQESLGCELKAITDTTLFETQVAKWLAAIGV